MIRQLKSMRLQECSTFYKEIPFYFLAKKCRVLVIFSICFFCFFYISTVTYAQDAAQRIERLERSTVVIIGLTRSGKVGGNGSGFVVAPNFILTNRHVTAGLRKGNLTPVVFVARNKEPLETQLVWEDSYRDVALLRVPGLRAPAFELNTYDVSASQKIGLIGFPADTSVRRNEPTYSEGVITKKFFLDKSGHRVNYLEYDAQSQGGSSGGPVVDMCGRVIGYHAQGTRGKGAFNRGYEIEHAIELIRSRSPEVKITASSNKCIITTAADIRARNAENRANKIAEDLRIAEAKRKEDEANRLKREKEQREADAKRQKQILIALGSAIGLLSVLTLSALIFAMRKPKHPFVRGMSRMVGMSKPGDIVPERSKSSPRSGISAPLRKQASNKSVNLSGFDHAGHRVSIHLDGRDLASKHGVTLGRSSDFSDHILNDDAVSKRHLRIIMENGSLMIEDLNSTNGTQVGGRKISSFKPQKIRRNDRITIGSLQLDVNL